jgi:2-(1,2-epoxy-1,2-dihydrophenyl)acetyl-CoA isomerase
MSSDTILFERQGGVAIITLNRPQALNSLTLEMHQAFQAALGSIQSDPTVRACIITGAGRGFCAGLDLGTLDLSPGEGLAERADPGPVIDQAFNPTTRLLLSLRVPTLAVVNGVAAGAGASLAMACDVAIAHTQASFVQAFSKIGLIPDAGGSWLLVERLGLARALALAMTGEKLSAAKACEWGMIWGVSDDPMAQALTMAQQLANMPTQALVATRHLMRNAMQRGLEQHLNVERDLQSNLGKTHDYLEGVMAFLEKRPPQFRGE